LSEKNNKFDATRCQILRLKCTKFDFRWRSPDPLAVFKGPTFKRKRKMRGKEGKGRGEEDEKFDFEREGASPQYFGR